MKIIFRLIAGVLGGVAGGMGMGGGTLLIPILTIFLSFAQLQAQGINLIAFIPMSIIALVIHAKNHLVKFKECWLLALVGAIISFASALVATNLNNTVLKKIFAIFLIILGIWQTIELIKAYKKQKQSSNKKEQKK